MRVSFDSSNLTRFKRAMIALALVAFVTGLPTRSHAEESRLRAAMNIELQILDPYITTATVTRAFGYMVYDTLIAMDSKGVFHPRMLDSWQVSDDRLTWTMTLRPGLTWHDGAPVTSEDCVASLRRWAKSDAFGKRMMGSVRNLDSPGGWESAHEFDSMPPMPLSPASGASNGQTALHYAN